MRAKRETQEDRESVRERQREKQRRETRGRATWVAGVARGAVRVLSPGESAEVGVEKRGKGLGN